MQNSTKVDFTINGSGSVAVLIPQTERAEHWIENHLVHDETVRIMGGVAIEPRYLRNIIEGFTSNDLTI